MNPLATLLPSHLAKIRSQAHNDRVLREANMLNSEISHQATKVAIVEFVGCDHPLYEENVALLKKQGFKVFSVSVRVWDKNATSEKHTDIEPQHTIVSWSSNTDLVGEILPKYKFTAWVWGQARLISNEDGHGFRWTVNDWMEL